MPREAKLLEENVDYELVAGEGESWSIRVLTGEFIETATSRSAKRRESVIQRSAHSAFFWTHGTVSMALKSLLFSAGLLR